MACFMCKGKLENKLTTFMIEVDASIIIIKNVPSMVCSQCGEISYSLEISKNLENILDRFSPVVDNIAIFEYNKVLVTA